MMTHRRRWVGAIREYAHHKPPEKVRRLPVVLAVANAFYDHGDDDGTHMRAGVGLIATETGVSPATVSRVRQWLFTHGLAHQESSHKMGVKAIWWHAAIPGEPCTVCTTYPAVGQVVDPPTSYPTEGQVEPPEPPTTYPTSYPSEGQGPVHNYSSNHRGFSRACAREEDPYTYTEVLPDSLSCRHCGFAPPWHNDNCPARP